MYSWIRNKWERSSSSLIKQLSNCQCTTDILMTSVLLCFTGTFNKRRTVMHWHGSTKWNTRLSGTWWLCTRVELAWHTSIRDYTQTSITLFSSWPWTRVKSNQTARSIQEHVACTSSFLMPPQILWSSLLFQTPKWMLGSHLNNRR